LIVNYQKSSLLYCTAKLQCFSLNDTTKTPDGNEISIGNLKIGDKVSAIDQNDQIVPTEIIAILHYENNSQGKIEKRNIIIESFFFQLCFIPSPLKRDIKFL
jgi:hypothetical protein